MEISINVMKTYYYYGGFLINVLLRIIVYPNIKLYEIIKKDEL